MKSRTWMWMTAASLFAALAVPAGMAAQDNQSQGQKHRHHQYMLIDIGTFGGPASYINNQGALGSPNQMNSRGTTVGAAATSIPSPGNSNTSICEGIDGNTSFVFHAFKWEDGVVTDLGCTPWPGQLQCRHFDQRRRRDRRLLRERGNRSADRHTGGPCCPVEGRQDQGSWNFWRKS
jgi:hypothetical protein